MVNGKNVFPFEEFQELRLLFCDMILFVDAFVELSPFMSQMTIVLILTISGVFSEESGSSCSSLSIQAVCVHAEKANEGTLYSSSLKLAKYRPNIFLLQCWWIIKFRDILLSLYIIFQCHLGDKYSFHVFLFVRKK